MTDHEGCVWKRVSLPPEFVSDLADFDLHPALLDGALSGTVKSGSGAEYVPHTYDCVRIFGPLAPEVLGITRRRSLGNADTADTTVAVGTPAARIHIPETPWLPPIEIAFKAAGIVMCKRVPARTKRGDCLFHLASDLAV